MREYKFRAFDQRTQQMLYGVPLVSRENNTYHVSGAPGDTPVMQFTGLKDSKGINIYEGDILNYNDYRVGNATTSEGKLVFVVSWEEETGCGCCGHSVGYDLEKSANIEVLGNIYENPDLLKNKS